MRNSLLRLVGRAVRLPALLLTGALALSPVQASPWVEVGDSQLRSDIEVLQAYGLFDNLATTWPMPWAQVARAISGPSASLPPHAQASLSRVRERFARETETGRIKGTVDARVTSAPTLVRDFDYDARQEIDARVGGEYMWNSTAMRLNVGLQSDIDFSDAHPVFDGSYIAQEAWNMLFYAGYIDHWWGGGWVGSIIQSNNARPHPRIGFMRNNPKAFETPWLSWIGPWQFNAYLGVLEDDYQDIDHPLMSGFRLAINPFPWLEIGASRIFQICGEGRSCSAGTWFDALFGNDNDQGRQKDPSNQLAGFDARISGRFGHHPFSLYGQYIGEDESGNLPSRAAGMFGASLAGPLGNSGAQWRVVAEYADTVASFLNSNKRYNLFYEHGTYTNGYRYRGRTMGHTIDNDGRLYSLLLSLTDTRNWTYRLSYHFADLNRDDGGPGNNEVSSTAEGINFVELGLDVPVPELGDSTLLFRIRMQDDKPNSPGREDFLFAAEAGWIYRF